MRTSGWMAFAAWIMLLAGFSGIIDGLVAIINKDVYLVTEDGITAFDFTAGA